MDQDNELFCSCEYHISVCMHYLNIDYFIYHIQLRNLQRYL